MYLRRILHAAAGKPLTGMRKGGPCDPPSRAFADAPCQSARSSLNVRCPEIIVETMDCRDMMSSRIAT